MDWSTLLPTALAVGSLIVYSYLDGLKKSKKKGADDSDRAAVAWESAFKGQEKTLAQRDALIVELTRRLEERTTEVSNLAASVAELKAQPNLNVVLEHLKEFRLMDERRYEDLMKAMSTHVETLLREQDRRFAEFTTVIKADQEAYVLALNQIVSGHKETVA